MMLKVDLHIHTIKSQEAFNTLCELAEEGKRRDLKIMGFTDHGPCCSVGANEVWFKQHRRFPKYISGVRTLCGAELNIIDQEGNVDLPEKVLKKLDLVACGLHLNKEFRKGEITDNTKAMLNAMQNPLIKVIAHPCYSVEPVDIEPVAHEAIKKNILLELNTSHFRYGKSPDPGYIERMKKMIQICQDNDHMMIIGSDAHSIWEVGDDSGLVNMQKELGYKDEFIINNYPEKVLEFFGVKG